MLLLLAGAAGLAALAVGCRGREPQEKAPQIKVGANLPLSDTLASYGKNVLAGVRLRVNEINDAGGIDGARIVLIVEDNKGDKTATRNAFKKLAQIDRVLAVIGPITSTNALAAKMDAEQSRVVLLTPTATNDAVTANTHYVFRACFNDSFQGAVVAEHALKEVGVRKAAVMTDKNSDYSKGLSAVFTQTFQAGGGQVVAQEGYQQKDTDFGPQLAKIKASGAEILFVPGYPPEVPLIIKQAKVVGFAGRLCGADGWDDPAVLEQSGDNIVGCFLVAMFTPADDRPMVRNFVRRCQEAGRFPGTFEAQGYDAMLLLGEALKSGRTAEHVAQALRSLQDVEGVTGAISFNHQGDAVKRAAVLQVVQDDGQLVTRLVRLVGP